MKKILHILPILLIITGCVNKKEKMVYLVEENLFKSLYNYSSYESIETFVDSAFTSIYFDALIAKNTNRILLYCEESGEYPDSNDELIKSTKNLISTFQPQYIGWKVEHKFRYKNKEKEEIIADYLYVFDEKVEHILFRYDLKNENYLKNKEVIDYISKLEITEEIN